MTKTKYKQLRETLYKAVSELGTIAELEDANSHSSYLTSAYSQASYMLDEIDAYGVAMGYVDSDTNAIK